MAILGSATATFALVLPSLILMVLISKMFMRYMHHPTVESVFKGLRPAVVGLLAAATLLLMTADNFSTPTDNLWQFCISCLLFIAAFVGVKFVKVNPIRTDNLWQFCISCLLFIAAFVGVKFVKVNPIRMIIYCAIAGLVLLY